MPAGLSLSLAPLRLDLFYRAGRATFAGVLNMQSQSTFGNLHFGNTRLLSGRNTRQVSAKASTEHSKLQERIQQPAKQQKQDKKGGLGDVLGPIGLTLGGELNKVKGWLTKGHWKIFACWTSL